jgi:hypothetical protein
MLNVKYCIFYCISRSAFLLPQFTMLKKENPKDTFLPCVDPQADCQTSEENANESGTISDMTEDGSDLHLNDHEHDMSWRTVSSR